ncbi:MAG TPA: molecular chaperone HtpG [Alphaproteobacteria bacterium]|nr:MAG: molecular chaperone HtpG [Rhodospirillales bacterium]HOO81319.1 molecular chaperone HtpG [Alphaproteobacteria bacterium]
MNAQPKTQDPSPNTHSFSADVSRLLDIVAHALYTNHDVFLRELISNSADACDRLRYAAIEKPELTADNPQFRIHIYKDTDARTLTVVDNGIGMSKSELIDHLGTIAKSGTAALMEKMKAGEKSGGDPLKLIGQFGVGFYAAYMVASHVRVISRKAGSKSIWVWESDGASGFNVRKASKDEEARLDGDRGTAIILDIKDEAAEFLINEKIKQTVETYSDHIDFKIFLGSPTDTDTGEGQPINKASAIWTRSKNDVTKEQYDEFYKHITHGFDEPLMTSHWHAEGKIEFSALMFIPTLRPWDLYDPSRKNAVRLYVRRVFISDNVEGLTYPWLRFVRGVIDSEDLPLNISRESLQYNPIITRIRTAVTKHILSDLDKLSRDDSIGFSAFWGQFGPAIKEGLYDAEQHREAIFKICRFYSTHDSKEGGGEKFTSLDEYIERMKEDQKDIYYISGENLQSLKNSPQIEGFRAKGIEVLFLTDTIDDFWLQNVSDYKGKSFKSVTKGDINLGKNKDEKKDEKSTETHKDLLENLKKLLEDDVSEVRISNRLTDSPVCLVAPEGGVDMHMERVLKIHQKYTGTSKPVLEINAEHPLIQKLETLKAKSEDFKNAGLLLFDQAKIIQGEPVKDPGAFARRMAGFISKGLD